MTPEEEAEQFEQGVAAKTWDLRVQDAARQRFAEETQGPAPPFDAGLLSEILARPEEPAYRIEDLLPFQGTLLVAALRKTGKTTLLLNLARCLTTAEKLLDRFVVRPVAGRVGFLNYEMSPAQLGLWASQAGVPEDRLVLVNLRGRRNPLGNTDDRGRLAEYLRGHNVESLIVDPFGSAYTGKSQNDPGEVRAWLDELDRYARTDVGVVDLVLTAHMGWSGERVRGASSLEDWGDGIAYMTTGEENERFFRAIGRDVSVDEDRLHFDRQSRLLSLTGTGNRRQATRSAKASSLVIPLCVHVREHPGATCTQIRSALKARAEDVVCAVEMAVGWGLVRVEEGGPGKASRHWLAGPVPEQPVPGDQERK